MAEKYLVPDGMYDAAMKHQDSGIQCSAALEAAICWLMPELERELTEALYDCFHSLSMPSMQHMVPGERLNYTLRHVWKKVSRIFLAPEPEVPEAIKDLLEPYGEIYKIVVEINGLSEPGAPASTGDLVERRNKIFAVIEEAYKRGMGNNRQAQKAR